MTQILKEYSIKEIEKFLPDYRLIKIEDVNGREIVNYNNPSTDIKKHWQHALKRFNSDLIPDDYYYICLSLTARKAKDPDKFLVKKGNPTQDQPNKSIQQPQTTKNDLITVNAALDYITQIANLKTEIVRLEFENKKLKEECAELSAEIEELEEKGDGLSENKANSTVEYLKETSPALMALADRFFEMQDKKFNLENRKLDLGYRPTQEKKDERTKQEVKRPKPSVKTFETGSEQHLQYIRLLYNNDKAEQLNKELDKLEQQAPEQYEAICNELNLFEDETTDQE